MSEPICQDPRAGGPYDDWKDVPCGSPATTTFDGRPVCEDHRSKAEDREREAIAETFFNDVPIEELRIVAEAGGLKELRSVLMRLVRVADLALTPLARDPTITDEVFRKCTESRSDALAFLYSGKP